MKTKIGLIDDHQLFLKSLSLLLESFNTYEVILEASNGKDLQEKIKGRSVLPEIMLIDVNMPIMNGAETATWLTQNYPQIQLVALSMNADDNAIISMFKAGCCGYLLKDTHPNELEKALNEIKLKGFYNADAGNLNFRKILMKAEEKDDLNLTPKEQSVLQYACSELTYKQIAAEMNLSERTIDGYRETLFKKFNVQSRVGLCLEAIRRELVKI
ncbi:MAG TPA: response regulator transcription factor [Niabella sp.]|nr:response regulator transcription factor [Niabella sp.]HOZ96608.1 response regulator transcription factor [Niabella sp.]HQW14524.1 response regulator transcription factor [Niabella sp.]HQX19939.1 response regulator transcription factor [Niabella sp.]HQX41184.1 response regulator transcription factor [Niabella sp.]